MALNPHRICPRAAARAKPRSHPAPKVVTPYPQACTNNGHCVTRSNARALPTNTKRGLGAMVRSLATTGTYRRTMASGYNGMQWHAWWLAGGQGTGNVATLGMRPNAAPCTKCQHQAVLQWRVVAWLAKQAATPCHVCGNAQHATPCGAPQKP
jgi:hypothetical protein